MRPTGPTPIGMCCGIPKGVMGIGIIIPDGICPSGTWPPVRPLLAFKPDGLATLAAEDIDALLAELLW